MLHVETTDTIIAFLNKIGIPVLEKELPSDTFLPGMRIEHGALAVDRSKLKFPGDMLHEAGHIAVMPPSARAKAFANAGDDQGEEIASQAWSYAAAVACNLPAEVVFHDDGYKGDAQALREHYTGNSYGFVGSPLLAWYQLTTTPDPVRGNPEGTAVYPHMSAWLRELERPEEA